ncbi:MAG: hypothetical protein EOM20_15700, partial [Spartobacteria bacterium]|nr:hypothetical protein [Spartobacteria bacterium]
MEIYFKCPKCDTRLDVDSEYANKDLLCPHCGSTIRVPRRILGPGITIGGFRIKKLLGKGGMGEVYLAHQLSMDRDVALKILPGHLTLQEDLLQRFLNEVRVAARLEHPNIVTAYEAGEDEGVYFLAMAYVKGESLAERLYRDGPMDEQAALDMIRKIAGALEYAWKEHRLLHRDIKPANIMFDAYGEPKLLDMGLSKCLGDVEEITLSPTVMGTPNYMSPEQARGDPLDLRADMYALGATLYHALTNQVPFHAKTVMETLQKQATDHLADPRDYNKAVSEGCVELLALMLAKHQGLRHDDWGSLLGDIERVRSGARPRKKPLQVGESTILKARELKTRQASRQSRSDLERWMFPLILVILLISAGLLWVARENESSAVGATEEGPSPVPVEESQQREERRVRMQQLRRRFKEAMQYARMHPDDIQQSLRELAQLRAEAIGTPFVREIQRGIETLAIEQQQAHGGGALRQLKEEAGRLADAGDFEAAIAYLEAYDGPHAERLAKEREAMIEDLGQRREAQRQQAEILALEQFDALRKQVVAGLLKQQYAEAGQRVQNALSNPLLRPVQDELVALNASLTAINRMPDMILESFRDDIGKEVAVLFATKKEKWEIQAVSPQRIRARRKMGEGYVDRTFTLDDLSFKEKFRRLGREESPDIDIMRGLLIVEMGSYQTAKQYFQRADTPLGRELADEVNRHISEEREALARKAYLMLVTSAGFAEAVDPSAETAVAIRRTSFVPTKVVKIRKETEEFQRAFGDTRTAQEAAPVLAALAGADTTPRDVDPQLVEQALKQLKTDNQEIMDLVAMYYLQDDGLEINLSGNPGLRDLNALSTLPIRRLNLTHTGVSNLEPLMRLPLQVLKIEGCPVADLTPLSRLPLRELHANGSKITDITALRDMRLRVLGIAGAKVSRIAALSNLPLEDLNLCGCPIDDLRALREIPLKRLSICWMPISDLRPIAHLPLEFLNIQGCWAIRDVSVLNQMKDLRDVLYDNLHLQQLMSPVIDALSRQDTETAAHEVQVLQKQFEGIPAFDGLVRQLVLLV